MGGFAGFLSGLMSSSPDAIDLSSLYNTIQNAGVYQKQLINALPAELQQNLAQYAQTTSAAQGQYTTDTQKQLNSYLQQVQGLYGPTSAAATAANNANKQNIYSTVPGTQNAVRNAMAATGGLQRGNAGVALAQPYTNAASQYSQATAGVTANQTAQAQQATQQALSTVNSMEANMFLNTYGMTKDQATTILQTGNQTLQNQLAELINQSNTEANQSMNVAGLQANANHQASVADTAATNALYGNAAQAVTSGLTMGASDYSTDGGTGSTMNSYPGMDTSSNNYYRNMNANAPYGMSQGF